MSHRRDVVPHGLDGVATLPAHGRLMGVDLGDVRVGIAITDEEQRVATPSATRPAGGTDAAQAADLAAVAIEDAVVGVVIGYPRTLEGREGAAAARARRVAGELTDRCHQPVVLWDERFTTVEAERVMLDQDASRRQRRAHIDRVAATLILQAVVEARSGGHSWR